MKKLFLILVIAAAFAVPLFSEAVNVEHFLITPSYNGAAGFIKAPGAYITPENTFAIGLHSFVFKANYGLFNIMEAGLNLDFTSTSDLLRILKGMDLNVKGRILKEEDFFVSLSAGIDKLPLNVFESMNGQDFAGYVVVSKKIEDMALSLGIKKQFCGYPQDNIFFADVSKVVDDTVLLTAEYNMGDLNTGIKVSLNSNIAVELYLTGLQDIGRSASLGTFLKDNFIFGITYIQ